MTFFWVFELVAFRLKALKQLKNRTGRLGWCCFRADIVGNSLKSAKNFAKSSFYDVTKLRNAGLPMVQS